MEDKIALYIRVSTKEQQNKGLSLEAQKNILLEFCKKNNYKIYKVYEEVKSATVDDNILNPFDYVAKRPICNEMIKDAEKGLFNIIIVFRYDRFARKCAFQDLIIQHLNNINVKVISATESDEFIVRNIKGILSEEEIRELKLRIRIGKKEALKQGTIMNRPPLGYIIHPLHSRDRKYKRLIIDKNKVKIVKDIFERYDYGEAVNSISFDVKIPVISVYKVLKNKSYLGSLRYNKLNEEANTDITINFPPIIEKELFDRVQEKLLLHWRKRK